MKQILHTSLSISQESEIKLINYLKKKYYSKRSNKDMIIDGLKISYWFKNLVEKIPDVDEKESMKIIEDFLLEK